MTITKRSQPPEPISTERIPTSRDARGSGVCIASRQRPVDGIFSLGGIEHIVRYALVFVGLSLLLTACAHSDTNLREQLIGTWSHGDSAELTFNSDGSFKSSVKTDASDVKNNGTWQVRGGVLITEIKHTGVYYAPGTTNIFSQGGPYRFHNTIIVLDRMHLAVASDDEWQHPYGGGTTNVWERR
ncbi:MAG TPA: hypothetical protein VK815_16710 [Candidatus Acidoferrales bacterium]|jgi:hypothetical protein|nr:hypothetical protein [Candidatus Acidoferrales bacterium]